METFLPLLYAVASSFYCFQKASHEMKNRQNIWMSVDAIAVATATAAVTIFTIATVPIATTTQPTNPIAK